MNGMKKFHKPTGPAFMVGEIWYAGESRCTIKAVRCYPFCDGASISDYEITYVASDGIERSNDAWNFQVRYTHHADNYV